MPIDLFIDSNVEWLSLNFKIITVFKTYGRQCFYKISKLFLKMHYICIVTFW